MRTKLLAFTAVIGISTAVLATTAVSAADPAVYSAAVASPDRPAEASELDEDRKPAEVLAFLGLEPGMTAGDLLTGTGYWAEIMSYVVGSEGRVFAYQPSQFYTDEDSKAAWAELEERAPGVSEYRYPFDAFAPPTDSLDFAIINLSYHDIYWTSEQYKIPTTDPVAYVDALYAGMKPGGIVGVIDHVGEGSNTRELVDQLHRIDPEVVRADFERAGFVLAKTSDLLANADDDHTKLVFDPSIRGKTDRFLMKFVKPR